MVDNNTIRRRRVLQSIGATGIAGVAGCLGGGGGGGGNGDGQLLLETAAGSPGGTGYVIMNALMSTASAEYPNLAYNILPGGWVGNNERLQSKDIHVGHTTMVAGSLAANGKDPYDGSDWESGNIRSVIADQTELFYYVVAQPDFEYDTLQEAADDEYPITVTNQPEGTFGGFVWDTALAELGYDQETIDELGGDYRRTSWDDMAQMFVDEDIDAILAVSGRAVGWLETITATRDVKYLQWTDENREYFSDEYGLLTADLESGTLPELDDTLSCMQDSGLVNAQVDAPEESIYSVVDGVIKNVDQVRNSADILGVFDADESMHSDVPFDLHPGAQDAYEDNDLL
ncbi:TAXI family TRAP transporter solute-binding subunit [Halosolutus halophilus]|uniref:TAXI family TRAP transporter solute-binding subunit n=1 Tax=Halosolutus halophilus TaxID=1552990 RepID=UPI0022350113|nr:TAXI family TRAP transporter solute-binding subunit [Halosolutus halophilus]